MQNEQLHKHDPTWDAPALGGAPFSSAQIAEILTVGEYRCAVCGTTEAEGSVLQVDHIKPLSRGGTSSVENGQVLCGVHGRSDESCDQTDSGKRMFTNLRRLASKENDQVMLDFVDEVLQVYEEHGINSHIEWKP